MKSDRVDPRPHIKLEKTSRGLRGEQAKEIRFLVDTEVVCSVIRPKDLETLKIPKTDLTPSKHKLRAVNGTKLGMSGAIDLKVGNEKGKIQNPFMVSSKIGEPIIGIDVLQKLGINIFSDAEEDWISEIKTRELDNHAGVMAVTDDFEMAESGILYPTTMLWESYGIVLSNMV